ncbi:sensor histidine kinase [Paenibacillus hodogayensis]|uniref:histidine kinase n=1 Tax=Paenibacillus hodogayensis TaxID=279208 RepID=A0ABV5W156_9BACL
MTFNRFLADRLGYIVIYLFNLLLVVLVIQLELSAQRSALGLDVLLYAGLLSIVGLTVCLLIDYVRCRPFYRQLDRLLQNGMNLDDAVGLQEAATREQQAMQTLLQAQYGKYIERLEQYMQQQEQHQTFVRQWVHQMKTPVSVIGLLTQQADQTANGETKRLAASVQEENERLAHGLDMMLHTARLEKFELDLHSKRVELIGEVRSVINEHKKACIRYRLFPKVEAAGERIWAETDEKWLRFVLNQLVTNAIKYSKPKDGAKTLTVKVEESDEFCRIVVKDEGIGIAEHELPRVFHAFFTGENGRKTGESTGMGLYLAKQVCDRLGHRLDIASSLGEGTEVTLSLARHAGLRRLS